MPSWSKLRRTSTENSWKKSQVIGGVDYQRSSVAPCGCVAEAVHVVDGADGSPEGVEALLGDAFCLKGGADVAGALAGSRPRPPKEVEAWLKAQTSRRSSWAAARKA